MCFLGYAIDKKAYKLLSPDDKHILLLRDVKFYENNFSYKMKKSKKSETVFQNDYEGIDHLNFFDTPYTSHNLSIDDNSHFTMIMILKPLVAHLIQITLKI